MTKEDFRRWRLTLDMTQADAAKALGRGKRLVESYERGEQDIPLYIELAAEALLLRHQRDAA